jgi:lipoyl(octanoyl) transferase
MTPPRMDWTPGRRTSAALQVHLLGPTDLDAALFVQDRVTAELAARNDTFGVLLLCEHPQGVTIGRDGSAADLQADRAELQSRGVPVRWLQRGGGAWAHHPGQLVAYVLLPVSRLGWSAPDYARRLTQSLSAVGIEQRLLPAEASSPGLAGRCGQSGFIGAAVSDGISHFGACLNVSVPKAALQLVDWGRDVRPTSLATERMRPLGMASIRECWIRHLAAQCGYEQVHLWTGHPLLHATTRRMYVCAEN